MQELDLHLDALGSDRLEMFLEELGDLFEILSGNQTHRDFGRSLRRDHRLGPLLDIAAPNAVHVERGANTRAFDGRKARFALDIADFERFLVFCKVERSLVEGFALGGRQLAHVVVEARNRHVSVFIDERSHHAGQDIGRIGHRTSEQAGVQVLVGACHFDLHISQTAQTAGDRRYLHRDHRCIGNQNDVCLEHLLVVGAELVEAGRPDLFLAFEQEFHIAGQAVGRAHRFERLGVHEKLAFVVVRTPAPDASVLHDRFERRGAPFVHRIDRHHVVVAVHQYGLGFGIDDSFGENNRIAFRGKYLGMVGTGLHQRSGQPFGASGHVGFMIGLRADRRDAQQLE